MRNITVSVPDHIYTQARVWAAERDVSLSAVVSYILQTLNGIPRANRHFPIPEPEPAPYCRTASSSKTANRR